MISTLSTVLEEKLILAVTSQLFTVVLGFPSKNNWRLDIHKDLKKKIIFVT